MQEKPGAEQVPFPGQSEGCSLPPDFPLTPSLAKGTLIRTDHSGQQPLLLI